MYLLVASDGVPLASRRGFPCTRKPRHRMQQLDLFGHPMPEPEAFTGTAVQWEAPTNINDRPPGNYVNPVVARWGPLLAPDLMGPGGGEAPCQAQCAAEDVRPACPPEPPIPDPSPPSTATEGEPGTGKRRAKGRGRKGRGPGGTE